MSIETKQMFIKDVSNKLSNVLTVDEMNILASALADLISGN